MRWLLIFLAVVNVVVLVWFEQQSTEPASVPEAIVSTKGVPSVALLSEVETGELKKRETDSSVGQTAERMPVTASAQLSASSPSVPDISPEGESKISEAPVVESALAAGQCGFVGPFADMITVRQVASRLKKGSVQGALFSESVRRDPIFWVYLKSIKGRAEALEKLRMLHAQGVDAFIVAEGPDVNAISLGFFTKKDSADKIQKERIAQGFDARVMQKERLRDQYWLVLQSEAWGKFSDKLAGELRKEYGEFTRRVRECVVVAAYDKFE